MPTNPCLPHPFHTCLLAATVALAICGIASATGTGGDAWGVRYTGQQLESLSDINTDKPERRTPLDVGVIATRRRGNVSITLLADGPSTALLHGANDAYGPELEQALDWLQRLRPEPRQPAHLILALVDPRQHVKQRRLHDRTQGIVVDLAVPLASVTSRSAAVGKAVAVGLHEISHAFSAGAPGGRVLDRSDDEYRASLVESCYLIDTMRVGDTLQLTPRRGSGDDEYFVTAQSRDAARAVVADLVRAAGTGTIRSTDKTALLGLKLACGIRLAQR